MVSRICSYRISIVTPTYPVPYSAVCLFFDLYSGAFCQPGPEFRSATAATAAVPTAATTAVAAAPTAASGAGVGLEPGAQQQPRAESCRQRLRKVGVRLPHYL